ncbi:MAG: type I-B CRISPR-associated endonuclease Cas1b [Ignavibacteria bacterium]|nr:type I-B CRISPR-associated endonuclease Cas1b [Ignavibacteria bacterium]
MKNNIYIFSNSVLRRKDNSFTIEQIPDTETQCEADIYERESDNVILPSRKINGVSKKHIPAESVEAFYTFGHIRFSSEFCNCCQHYGIPVHIFNYYGKYIGSFIPKNDESSGKIILLQSAFYFTEEKRLEVAREFIEAAARNSVENLNTHFYAGADLEEHIIKINNLRNNIKDASSVQELMGIEGNIKAVYYDSWKKFLRQETRFEKRIKNPPEGMINSLISYGNSVLYSVCLTEIHRTRLNPFIGFLHETGDGKHSLAFDISEIFKPVIVDKVIFRVINLNMLNENDFRHTENGMLMKDKAKRKFIEEFENRLKTVITHKRLNRRVSYRSLIRMECYNLINYITGKLTKYESYRST